jgi:hypothetical protein
MEEPSNRDKLKKWLESGEVRLQPLSFPQREIWENSPVPVGDPANHICAFIEIGGAFSPEECGDTLTKVVDRHEALRSSFLPGKERTLEMIRTTAAPNFSFRELTTAECQPEVLEEVLKETYRKPFDIVQGPLYRVDMLRRGQRDHLLAFSVHHAIADGWSLGVFVQDLSTAYVMSLKGLRKAVATSLIGMPDKLSPVPQSYTAWAATERMFWQPQEIERRADFWRNQLKDSRQIWSSRTDIVRNKGPLQRHIAGIDTKLTKAVRDLAARHGATLYSTLLSAFQITLWKSTGQDDIVVGTPVANRSKVAVHQTMGYFAGVVPMRGQVDPDRVFSDHLRATHSRSVDSFSNAIPFAELAIMMHDPDNPTPHPIFDVRFALQNHPVPDVVLPRISTKLRMRSTGTARFDLGCEITEMGSELEVVWLYRTELFDEKAIKALDTLYNHVITEIGRYPEKRINELKP